MADEMAKQNHSQKRHHPNKKVQNGFFLWREGVKFPHYIKVSMGRHP